MESVRQGEVPPPPRTKNLTIITEKITNMAIGQSFDGCPSKVYWLYTHFVTMDHTGPQQQLLAFVVRAVSGPSSSVRDMERRGCPEHVSTCQNLFPKQRGSPFKPALFFSALLYHSPIYQHILRSLLYLCVGLIWENWLYFWNKSWMELIAFVF